MTKITDIVKYRDAVNDFTIKRIFDKAATFKSGLVVAAPAIVPVTGKQMNMPSWNQFNGLSSVLDDTTGLTPETLSTNNEIALVNSRGHAISANDLVNYVSGSNNIVESMANLLGDYWARELNKVAISTALGSLLGVDAVTPGSVINDISLDAGAGEINFEAVYDTVQLNGEFSDELTLIVMHSAVLTHLKKQNVVETVRPSDGGEFSTYLGRQVVVDDSLAASGGVYTTILAKSGAMGFADGTMGRHIIEMDRDILGGNDTAAFRRRFALHAAGSSCLASPVGTALGVSNATLALEASHTLPYADTRNFGMVALVHKLVNNA